MDVFNHGNSAQYAQIFGSEDEVVVQISALWALRNFGIVDMYRARMAGMGVVALCLRVLDMPGTGSGVQHAAVALLQMLSSNDAANVNLMTEAQVLPNIAPFLYGKHKCAPYVIPWHMATAVAFVLAATR